MEKIRFLKQQYSHLPAQGTDAWLESRRTKIGGSEVASVIGKSPYMKPYELICKKNSVQKKLKSAACTFGRIFEDVAVHHIEVTTGLKVHHLGAIPSSMYPVCYSPDGVLVVDGKLELIEIKCPFRRSKIETVPDHYNCQIQTGMNVLPCNTTRFYQFRFRACKIEDMGPTAFYNRWLHFEARKRCPPTDPLAWGYLHWAGDHEMVDLGSTPGTDSEKLCIIDGKDYTIHHAEDHFPETGYILPWKLFDVTMVQVDKDPTFLDTHSDVLWATYSQLSKAKDET